MAVELVMESFAKPKRYYFDYAYYMSLNVNFYFQPKSGVLVTPHERTPIFQITPLTAYESSPRYSSIIAGIFIAALIVTLAIAVYYYVRTKMAHSGKFDIGMRFQNPTYGLERSESFSHEENQVQPGQHEYTNPVMINPKEMEAAAEVVLQRAKQNPFSVADSANESYNGTKLIKF